MKKTQNLGLGIPELPDDAGLWISQTYANDIQTIDRILTTAQSTTYDQLVSMAANAQLVPGNTYRCQTWTKYQQPITGAIKTGDGETLLITATSKIRFAFQCRSVDYPQDIVYYDFFDNICEDGHTERMGFIHRRIDTERNIDLPFDWRKILWPRFKGVATSWTGQDVIAGSFYSDGRYLYKALRNGTPDISNASRMAASSFFAVIASMDAYVFCGNENNIMFDRSDAADRYTFDKADATSKLPVLGNPGANVKMDGAHLLANIVFGGNGCNGIYLRNDCRDMTFLGPSIRLEFDPECRNMLVGADCYNMRFGAYCNNFFIGGHAGNYDIGAECSSNVIKTYSVGGRLGACCRNNYIEGTGHSLAYLCDGNVLWGSGANNKIEETGQRNAILNGYGNTISPFCKDNTLSDGCIRSKLGPECQGNTLGGNNFNITLEAACQSNTLGNYCGNIKLATECTGNMLGNECQNTELGSKCSIKAGDRFSKNIVEAGTSRDMTGIAELHAAVADGSGKGVVRVSSRSSGVKEIFLEG